MLNQITPNIYVSDNEELNDRPQLGYIKGSKYAIMIDAGNSPAHAQLFIDELKKMDLKAPDFVILTHWHWDQSMAYAILISLRSAVPRRKPN